MYERPYEQVVSAVTIDPITSLTVVLAALAVLLAALTIIIGIAAVWGYLGIKEDTRKIATEAAHKKLVEYFENESLKDKIRQMVPAPPVQDIEGKQDSVQSAYTGEEDKGNAGENNGKAE
jgi:hypothetical protein